MTFAFASLAALALPLGLPPGLPATPAPETETPMAWLADAPRASAPVATGVEAVTDASAGAGDHLAPHDPDHGAAFSYRRAALELGGLMALGAAWYQAEIDFNRQDFDFDRSWSGQAQRLLTTRGYRFDDNDRRTNIAHAFVGRTYHGLARANHATLLQAFLFDLTASSVWEAAIENREVFSLNDTVVTAVGGVPLGEASFQIGELFARSAPTWRNRLLLAAFSPARAFLSLTEGGHLPRASSLDRHGLADDASHRFVLSTGGSFVALAPVSSTTAGPMGAADVGSGTLLARLDLELINLRAYGREGSVRRTLAGGEATGLALGYQGTPERMDQLTVSARSSLFGTFSQELTGQPDSGSAHGQSLLLAAGSAFDLTLAEGDRTPDFLTSVHMIGPTADALIYRGPMTVRLASDLYGDFAMVRPFALGPDAPATLLEGAKSVLRERAYYYALGLTAAARAEARYRGLRAGAAFEWSGYDSVEGLDRQQDTYVSPAGVTHPGVTDDFAIADQRFKLRVYTELPTPIDELRLGLSLDMQRRSGEMKDLDRSEDEGRASAVLSFVM